MIFICSQENFSAARYHLAASLVMMDKHKEDDLVIQDLEEEEVEKGSKTETEKEVEEKDKEETNLEEDESKESQRYKPFQKCLLVDISLTLQYILIRNN